MSAMLHGTEPISTRGRPLQSRRRTVGIVAAATLLLSACGGTPAAKSSTPNKSAASTKAAPANQAAAKPLTHVKLLLDWVTEGYHAPLYLAQAKGYYKAAGLDVQIIPGKGSLSTVQQVGHGNYPFGFATAQAVVEAVGKGIPVKMVADYQQLNPVAFISLPKSNIRKPADLIGKSIGIPPGSSQLPLLPAFLAANHIAKNQVRIVGTTAQTIPAALASGKVASVVDFNIILVPQLAARGIKTRQLLWSKYGVTVLSIGLVVNDHYLQQHEATVRAFVQATDKAWVYAKSHPQEAIAALKQMTGSVPPGALDDMQLGFQLLHTANTQGKPAGWMSPKDWTATVNILHRYMGLPLKPTSDYYTDAEIGSGSA